MHYIRCQHEERLSIDNYFTLLSAHLHRKLSVYNCVWFSSKLFINQDPNMPKIFFNNRESTFLPWFTEQAGTNNDFIIMLMSILNKHFVVVMDLQLQAIYVGDSFGKPNDSIVNQCRRYLCYEYFQTLEKKLNLDMWKIINYCNADVDFPLQSDSHNCGPYICLITKCIFQGTILRSKSVTCLRCTIAYELINNTIL